MKEVDEDMRGDGGHFLHFMLHLSFQSADDMSERSVHRGGSAVQTEPPVESADRGEIALDTLGELQAVEHVEPDGEPTQFFASEWERVNVGQFSELLEGLSLRIEGSFGARSPRLSHHVLHVFL